MSTFTEGVDEDEGHKPMLVRLKDLDEVTAISVSPGNADANDYLHGMANGLILAQAIMQDKEPEYIKGRLTQTTSETMRENLATIGKIGEI